MEVLQLLQLIESACEIDFEKVDALDVTPLPTIQLTAGEVLTTWNSIHCNQLINSP